MWEARGHTTIWEGEEQVKKWSKQVKMKNLLWSHVSRIPIWSPYVELHRDDKLAFVVGRECRYELPFVVARDEFMNS
jgi:hypothetical protein